nr:helix-turn-helix transcriptional regulator [Telluria aromaticivorans]
MLRRHLVELLGRFGVGLRAARKSRGLTQEDFSTVSSRTYLSSLERGIKSPTISKIEDLATIIGVHPVTLLALAYLPSTVDGRSEMCSQISAEIHSLLQDMPANEDS